MSDDELREQIKDVTGQMATWGYYTEAGENQIVDEIMDLITARYGGDRDDSSTYERDVATMDLASRIAREHEPRPMGCSCGAQLDYDLDRRWHLISVTLRAQIDEQERTP